VTAGKNKQLLFSLTKKDFVVQTFCTGGNGGGHRNAKQNGVRIIHPASGARAEHRDGRDQAKNKVAAFKKLVETPEFKAWHKVETMRLLGQLKEIEERVDDAMRPEHIKIEEFNVSS
jgi:protein subunit release factor A